MTMLSLVVPVFNEEENIEFLFKKIVEVFTTNNITDYEIIFVDDGSIDNTFSKTKELSSLNNRVRGVSLSRNFGHQIALFAGIEFSKGDVVITMDGDMQHPPEVIPELIRLYKSGFDIVNTKRIDAEGIGFFKKATSKFFYKFINLMSDVYIEPASSDFRLMSRKAADAFLEMPENDRFTRGLISWMGFRQAFFEYKANPRYKGKSKYSVRKMMRFAFDGITSFSTKPLRVALYFGFIFFMLGMIYAAYAVVQYFQGHTIQGWTSILLSVIILGSIQLLSIGLLGEYLARISREAKNRPKYFVKDITSNG
ncbi:MAG: glycosyltransferase family 2 protein [Bacteroidetes bacterium]|nr:glycosyltransferase family 2 protein [Bacteroidota bacterium]